MEYLDILLTVSLIWMIAVLTPGPNFFITVHTAVGETRRLSLYTVSGIVVGTVIWTISGFWGVTLIFKTMPFVYYFLKIVGGCYLVYIGLRLLFFSKKTIASYKNIKTTPAGSLSSFKTGLYTNLLNPKTAAFITSLFAATIPAGASITLGMLCILCICSISAAWYSLVSIVFSHERAKKVYVNFKSYIERIAGGIFIFFGIKLAITE